MTKVRRSFDPDFRAGAVRIVKIVTTPVRAPRANAIAELFVGSLRCELLGRILIVNQRHAAALLAEYDDTSTNIVRTVLGQAAPLRPLPDPARSETSRSTDATASAASSTNTRRSRSRAELWAPTRPARSGRTAAR